MTLPKPQEKEEACFARKRWIPVSIRKILDRDAAGGSMTLPYGYHFSFLGVATS